MANLTFRVRTDINEVVAEILARTEEPAETAVAQQVLSDTSPFVPMLTGKLDQSARTVGNTVIYPGPYARYLYYGKVMVNAATGKGPSKFIGKNGNEVIAFPKGSKLKATDKDLVIKQKYHHDAQSHWFEASKAQNLDKWLRAAAEAVTEYGK